MFAQHLVSIELIRPRQRLRLRDGRAEPLPRDHRGDRAESVSLAIMRRDQGGADARVEAHLLVDGPTIGLEVTGMPCFGFAEHGPNQPVEQIDGLVGQIGGEIEADGDQSGVPALTLKAGHILYRGAAGFTDKLSEPRLMNPVSARRVKTGQLDCLQALDQSEHRHGLRRFRHLAQPGKPALAGVPPAMRQAIQLEPLIGGQSIGQPPMDFPPRMKAGFNAEPLERAR